MAAKSKSLLDLFLIYGIGTISTRLINFVLIFVTTFYLNKEQVGQYDLILITLSLLTPLATLQLADSALRWLLEDSSVASLRKVVTNTAVVLLGGLLLVGAILLIVNLFDPIPFLSRIYVLILFQSIFLLTQQCVRGQGDNKTYVVSGILYTLLYASFTLVSLAVLHLKVDGIVTANILAIILVNVFVLFRNKLYRYFSLAEFDLRFAKELLRYSVPLIPNSLSWWAISSLNRYLILVFIGIGANGIFAISYKIPTILLVFISIFNFSWQEKAITTHSQADKEAYYSVVLNKYIRVLFSIAILITAINKYLLQFIVSEEFHDSWRYTSILLFGVVFCSLSTFYGTIYLTEKRTDQLLFSSIFGGLITACSAYFLIPTFQLYGASFSIFLGYFALFVIRVVRLNRTVHIQLHYGDFFLFIAVYLGLSIINYIDNLYLGIAGIAAAGGFVLYQNLELINDLLKRWKVQVSL